jgi:hypothetical protein
MEKFKIHQLVYTKLNPEDSPFEKKDFHTAFYPLDFLSGTEVMIVENHIFIPSNTDFTTKQVALFLPVKQETYLLVFDINLLPGETDTLGRGGIFICQVFFFPKALWQQIPSPNMLMGLVKDFRFNSRNELLASTYIDRKTGNMLPLEISAEIINTQEWKIPQLESSFEIQLVLNLVDSMKKENKESKFIVSAPEPKARDLFNRIICYLPEEIKVKTGWDTMYDGGRMMDYNKSFAGYQEKAPKGAAGASTVYLNTNKIELAAGFSVSKEKNPFEKWIGACPSSIEYHSDIEKAYKLSGSLLFDGNKDVPLDWNSECFANVNKELIEKLFLKKSLKEFKKQISRELNKILPPRDKLLYFFSKLSTQSMADYLLHIIENSKISSAVLEKNISALYIDQNPVLIPVQQLWKNNRFDKESFNRLSENQKLQLNRYVIRTDTFKSLWYLELVKTDEKLLSYFIRQYPKPEKIISLYRKVLKMNESEINQLGFGLSTIRKVCYFRMAYFFCKIPGIFVKKKQKS